MQNAYVSSSIYSIGTHGSLSYSFNGCSYLLNERFDRNPIHFSSSSSSKSCCCSCCCGFSNQRVSINPCYLYGLRQSSLLQWSASRRLILNGGDRCSYRIQECSPDLGCNELPCTVPERSVYSRRGRRRKGRCHCIVDGEADNEVYNSSEVYDSGDLDDAEAMLSLLSEELGEDFFGRERSGFSFKRLELEGRRRVMSGRDRNVSTSKRVEEESWRSLIGRERKVSSSKRVEKERRRNFSSRERNLGLSARVEAEGRRNFSGRERNVGSFTRVEAERRAFGGREKSGSSSKGVQVEIEGTSSEGISGKKKSNGMLSSLESNSIQFEPTTIDLSEGDTRQKEEERGMILRGDNWRGRKGGSSCSSYYSFLSSGDFGSETDVQDKHGIFEEPASSLYKDSKYDKGGRVDGQASEDYQNYRDDSEGNGERKYQRNTTAEGGVMWDWRKKTEKKLTEVVTEEKRGDEKSSRVLKTNQSELQNASGSRKQLHDEHESSYFTTGAREQNSQTGNQVVGIDMTDSRRRFQERNESDIYRNDVATTSWSKRHSEREENLEITTNLGQERKNEHYKTASYIRQKEDLNRDTQKGSRTSETRVVDAERTSDWQRQSDTRRVYQEENRNMLPSSASETEVQRHQIDQQILGFINSGRKSQQITEISEISDSGIERDNIIQSDLVPASGGESSEPRHEIDEKAFQRVLSRKGTDDVTEMLLVHASNTERNSNSQRMSKKRTVNQESAIISAAPSIEEATQRNNETDVKLMQVKPTKEAQSSRGPSNFHKKDSLEASSFQASFSMVSQATMQPHDVQEHKRTPQAILLPPSSQLIAKGSSCIESPSAMATQEVSEEISDGCSPAGRQTSASLQESSVASGNTEAQGEILYLIPEDALGSTYRLEKSSSLFVRDFVQKVRHQGSTSQNQNENTVSEANLVYGGEGHGLSTSVSLQESCSGDGNPQTQGEIISLINPEDALDSAHRLEKSSLQFVGDFSERVRHEVSTSENQNANTVSEAKLVHGGEEYGQRNSGKKGAENFQTKENDSRRSSGGSGTKGPADEMWDVADTSVLKTPKAETLELATIIGNAPKAEKTEAATTSGNAIVKRSGRSVWNIVADIVRLRWGLHAESPRSAVKSGGRTSSNESASSEAWFSGREPEESGEKNEKRDKDMLPETTSDQQQPGKTFSQSRGEVFGIMRSKDTVRYLEAGMPSSTNNEEGGLTSKSISLSSSEETLDSQENQKSFPDSSSGIAKVESSQPLVSRGTRSPLVEEISNSGNTVSGSGSMEDMDQFGSRKLTEVSDNMQKGGELKQRRFQRTKQVLRDRFDEWEEAHTLEIEQRKIDEMFMREALLEAKKAADTWEVPVGAVLVQQGKVIARGFNLVEELRDSTAHAEMICIREASNLLRSWRLADATLYVTLEPCPMCAGAILQARIDTVVWGAPNKLLGADGSWIRLFPDGSGANSSEQSDKPAPPVHPFHPNMTIRRGVLASECADIMQQFFQLRRKKKGKQADPPAPASHRPVSHHPSKILTKMHDIFHLMFCL